MQAGEVQASGLPGARVSVVAGVHRLVQQQSEPRSRSQQRYTHASSSSSSSSSKARVPAAPPNGADAAEMAVAPHKHISTTADTGGSVGAADRGETYLDCFERCKTGLFELFLQRDDPRS